MHPCAHLLRLGDEEPSVPPRRQTMSQVWLVGSASALAERHEAVAAVLCRSCVGVAAVTTWLMAAQVLVA